MKTFFPFFDIENLNIWVKLILIGVPRNILSNQFWTPELRHNSVLKNAQQEKVSGKH